MLINLRWGQSPRHTKAIAAAAPSTADTVIKISLIEFFIFLDLLFLL